MGDASITIQQALALINAGGQLVAVGLATAQTIRAAFKSMAPGLTDDDLNAIVQGVREDARWRTALADREIADAQARIDS